MSTVLITIISLFYNVLILHVEIEDVLTIMMLLYTAVSWTVQYIIFIITTYIDNTMIWESNPYTGMIRLEGGHYSNQGRVEVYCNGQWGTICSDGFDFKDAYTVCRQLGYTGYVNYNHLAL